jgi:hypothetical protein
MRINHVKADILLKALKNIATMPAERNEWDAVDLYEKAQDTARKALSEIGIEVKLPNYWDKE